MNCDEAKVKCESLGMRLPTREEGLSAYNMKLAGSWKKEHSWWTLEDYWSSTLGDEGNSVKGEAFTFSSDRGRSTSVSKWYGNHVRCIR